MKCIYVISPDYLQPLLDQAKNFSFDFKGYNSIKSGLDNLKYTNMSDILGVAIVLFELPPDLGQLVDLINALNRSAEDLPVVLVAQRSSSEGFSIILSVAKTNNLRFYGLFDFDDMTDLVIKQSIYGTIVLDKFSPYMEEKEQNLILDTPNTLSYKPIFSEEVSALTENVVSAPNAKRAICDDKVAIFLHSNNPVLYLIRCLQIFKIYGEVTEIERVRLAFSNYIGTVNNEKERLLYEAIYNIVERGGVDIGYRKN